MCAAERHRWARLTLEAHLIKLAREGRVGEHDGVWRTSVADESSAERVAARGERAARRQMGVARHHAGASKPASAGRSSATTAPARRSCSSCCARDVWPTPTGREERDLPHRPPQRSISSRRNAGSPTSAPNCRTNIRATAGTSPCATWSPRGCIGTDLLLRARHRARRAQPDRRDVCAPAASSALAQRREFLSLSYGQKRLALLARALVAAPDWLCLDEFYNGLDARLSAPHRPGARRGARRGQLLDRGGTSRLRRPARHARHASSCARGGCVSVRVLRRADLARLTRAGGGSRCARARPRPAPGSDNAGVAGARAAVDQPVLLRLSRADLYVDYRSGAARPQLGIAPRRALGGVRREWQPANRVF